MWLTRVTEQVKTLDDTWFLRKLLGPLSSWRLMVETTMAKESLQNVQIVRVRAQQDLEATRNLFREYVKWLDLDLAFQGLDDEMSSMPGKYAPPKGELLLAKELSRGAIGCVAVRLLSDRVCEMKRLYVVDAAKGMGIGRRLVAAVIEVAIDLGYQEMRLDTLPRMAAALNMYRSHGFVEIPAYYATPLKDTHFLSLDLSKIDS